MFKEQARRLLRTVWQTPEKLATEVYAILSSDGPLDHQGTLNLTPEGDQPAIRIVVPGTIPDGFNPIQVVHPNPDGTFEPVGFVPIAPSTDPAAVQSGGPLPDSVTSGGGGGSPLPDKQDSGDTGGTEQADPRAMPVTCLGKVVGGSGSQYSVGVWLDDPAGGTADFWMTVPASVIQIDPSETIDPGTIVVVTLYYPAGRTGAVAVFQPPVAL